MNTYIVRFRTGDPMAVVEGTSLAQDPATKDISIFNGESGLAAHFPHQVILSVMVRPKEPTTSVTINEQTYNIVSTTSTSTA